MFTALKRLPIATQSFIFLLAIFTASVAMLYFRVSDSAIKSELSSARATTDIVELLRNLASEHGGVYIRREVNQDVASVGPYMASYPAEIPTASGSTKSVFFHLKSPSQLVADLATASLKNPSTPKFKMVSDNFINPSNAPDSFESDALRFFREKNKDTPEYFAVVRDQLRYARPIRAVPSCLACHGSFEQVPEEMRRKYAIPIGASEGRGYGYQLGSIVGVTSVATPHQSVADALLALNFGFWIATITLFILVVFSYLLLSHWLAGALQRLTSYANAQAQSAEPLAIRPPVFTENEATSRNEIHQLSTALKRRLARLQQSESTPPSSHSDTHGGL